MNKGFDPGAAALPGSGIFGLPPSDDAKVTVVPVPFAATCSYGGGAENGPEAILAASKQVDLFDLETGRPYEAGIVMRPLAADVMALHREARALAAKVIEAGGRVDDDPALATALARVNSISEEVNRLVHAACVAAIANGKLVALVGGDHSTPYGCIRAHAEAHPGLGLLHVDAHADLRVAYEGFTHSHASIMHNVLGLAGVAKIVQVGIRDLSEEEFDAITGSSGRVKAFFDPDLRRAAFESVPWSQTVHRIVDELPARVYVSFDIDGLDPTLCPHTGTPVPGGLSFAEAGSLVARVVASGRTIVGLDVNEVSPAPDASDEWDANVGARVLYKLIGWMLASHARAR
jgi:agmatinase